MKIGLETKLQDEWKHGLEFGCFATMLRMFLVFDSFMSTRFQIGFQFGFRPFAYPIFKTILEPDFHIIFKIGLNRTPSEPDSTFHFAYLNTPVIMKPKRRAILVRLPETLVDRLDAVAYDLRMRSRSDYIRCSLERALEFSEAHEVPLLEDPELQRALAR